MELLTKLVPNIVTFVHFTRSQLNYPDFK